MPDWNSRIAVYYQKQNASGAADGSPVQITPVDTFQQTVNTPATALHSLEQTHVGAVFSPVDIQFTMTMKQNAALLGTLTQMALNHERFQLIIQEAEGSDWTLASILLTNCLITTMQVGPYTTTAGAVPVIVINGVSLHTKYTLPDNSTAEAGSLL